MIHDIDATYEVGFNRKAGIGVLPFPVSARHGRPIECLESLREAGLVPQDQLVEALRDRL